MNKQCSLVSCLHFNLHSNSHRTRSGQTLLVPATMGRCVVSCVRAGLCFLLTTRHIPPPSSGELLKTARRKQINCSHCLFLAIRLPPHPNTNKRKKQKLDERGKKPRNWRIPDAPHFQLSSACRCRVCLSSQFDQGATPNPSSWFNHGLCGHAGRVTPFFFSSTSSGGRVREKMERQGMEGNNLLHFLDTPSAHYRRFVVFFTRLLSDFIDAISCSIFRICSSWACTFPRKWQVVGLLLFVLKDMRRIWGPTRRRWTLWDIRFVNVLWHLPFPFHLCESSVVFSIIFHCCFDWGKDMIDVISHH